MMQFWCSFGYGYKAPVHSSFSAKTVKHPTTNSDQKWRQVSNCRLHWLQSWRPGMVDWFVGWLGL